MDKLDESIEILSCHLNVLVAARDLHSKYLPIHFAGQSNTHNDPGSRQTVRLTLPSPCMSRPLGGPAGGIPTLACHHDKAKHVSHVYPAFWDPTYLGLLRLVVRSDGSRPPQMTRQVHGSALIRLAEKLASVLGTLGDECVVVFFAKVSGLVKGSSNYTDRLELCL